MMDICTLTELGLRLRLDKWFESLIGEGEGGSRTKETVVC